MRTLDNQPRAPYPGSARAVERGCVCPTVENGHGGGRVTRTIGDPGPEIMLAAGSWWVEDECSLHGLEVIDARP